MDATRVHLFITHLPVFGLFLGFCALLFGVVRNDKGVKLTSLAIIIVAIIGGLIAFQTGEPAEETVENIAGISHDSVEAHEEAGEISNVFFIGLGLLAILAVYFETRNNRFSKQLLIAVLALSLITFYFVARTATLGGKIRHVEIVAPA